MKRIMQRSYFVLLIVLAFLVGVGLLTFRVATQNKEWVEKPYNGHMQAASQGKITDRKGTLLAYDDDNMNRCYHQDESVRKALLHVVGDTSGSISTAIQSMYQADLTGYSFVLGLGLPKSLRSDNDVQLTVDANACKAAYEALNGYKGGACVVYNYKTGEVLCSVSTPTYDPANPPEITEENESEYEGVYLDNVLSSTYTPGSTFKIITAAAAMEYLTDIDTRTFTCNGAVTIGGHTITCDENHSYYREITFEEAFAHSCNVVFAQLAAEIGSERMTKTAEKMGFNSEEGSMSGIPLAKSRYKSIGADEYTLAMTGIGQGLEQYEDKANPMRMAMLCGAVANNGTAVSPYIIEDDGSLFDKLGITGNKGKDVTLVSAATVQKLKKLMGAAADYYRSSYHYDMAGLAFYAKTGTAQRGDGKAETGWFVGFCDDPSHPYAFAAVVEEGGYGIYSAAEVARAAVEALVYG